jgi:hypothetical protein
MSHLAQQLGSLTQTIRVMNAVAAGTSVQNSAWVDCQNSSGIRFIALLGTLTATQTTSMKLQGANAANQSDAADLKDVDSGAVVVTANMADGDSNKMLVAEVYRLKCRYVRAVITRGVANAVIDGVIAQRVVKHPAPALAHSTQAGATAKGDFVYI